MKNPMLLAGVMLLALAAAPPDMADRTESAWPLQAAAAEKAGDYARALACDKQALALAQKAGNPAAEADALNHIGAAYNVLSQFTQAIAYDQQALTLARRANDRTQQATALNQLADVYHSLSQYDKSLGFCRQALQLARSAHDEDGQAQALINSSQDEDDLGQYAPALRDGQQALALAQQIKSAKDEAVACAKLSSVEEHQGGSGSALADGQRSLQLARSIQYLYGELEALFPLCQVENDLNHYAAALDLSRQALSLARRLRCPAGEAQAQAMIGLNNVSLDQFGQAIAATQQGLLLANQQHLSDPKTELALLLVHSIACRFHSQYPDALRSSQQALVIARRIKDRKSEGMALMLLCLLYDDMDKPQQSLAYGQEALAAFNRLGDQSDAASALKLMGMAYDDLSQYDRALDLLQQSLALEERLHDLSGERGLLVSLSSVCIHQGKYGQALAYLQRALPIFRQLGDPDGEATTLNNISQAYDGLSQFGKALDYLQRALPLLRQAGDRKAEAQTLCNIGGEYERLSQYDQALDNLQRALPIQRQIGDPDGEATTLNNISQVYDGLGQYDKAIAACRQALPLFQKDGNAIKEATVLGNIGKAYNDLGQYAQALDYSQRSLSIRRRIGDPDGEATSLINLGADYSALGRYVEAVDFYGQALPILQQIGDREFEATVLSNLMAAWKAQDAPRLAIFYGKQSVNTYQGIRGDIQTMDQKTQQTYLGSVSGTYRALADLLIGQGRLPEAEQVLGLLKEREFFGFVQRSQAEAGPGAQTDFTHTEAGAREQMQALGDGVAALGVRREALLAHKPLTDDQQKEADDLDQKIAAANAAFETFLDGLPALFSQTTQDKITTLRDTEGLQSTLGDLGHHSVALYTLVGPDKLRLLLVTPQVEVAREYPITAADLNRKVADFRAALEDPARDPRPLGKQIYDILIGPVAKDLADAQAETIMWSLDGTLRYLPVAALYDGRQYLVERYTGSIFTPASMTRLDDTPRLDWSVLGMGVSKAQPGFDALPGTAGELRGIVRGAGGGGGVLPGTTLLDDTFTQTAMQHDLRQGYTVVHIASHFAFRPGDETQSFLLLGDGTHLSLADMKTMPGIFQNVSLLTLSACDTAMGGGGGADAGGGAADGSEVEGFGVLAQRKGAEAVLATLWPVADRSTELLMEDFYRRHQSQSGITKAEALRQAQLSLLRGTASVASGATPRGTEAVRSKADESDAPLFVADPKAPYAHPYYWAPFVLFGNWR